MRVVCQPMRAADVSCCAAIVTGHPVYAARYGSAAGQLANAWLRLLHLESFRAARFCDLARTGTGSIGVGVSAFVRREFLLKAKTPPFFWLGPELLRLTLQGEAPLLSNKQMRAANLGDGLDLVVWAGSLLPEYEARAEAYGAVVTSFLEQHRGFPLREMISQAHGRPQLEGMLRSGGLLMDGGGNYHDPPSDRLTEIILTPHCVGLTREIAHARPGSWVGALFSYQPPLCGFTSSEQRLLLAALRGGTNEELATQLQISLSAVKKGWLLIYARATARLARVFDGAHDTPHPERGREKKQRLLAYLREHPEELRPGRP